jgi:hypothetical protein
MAKKDWDRINRARWAEQDQPDERVVLARREVLHSGRVTYRPPDRELLPVGNASVVITRSDRRVAWADNEEIVVRCGRTNHVVLSFARLVSRGGFTSQSIAAIATTTTTTYTTNYSWWERESHWYCWSGRPRDDSECAIAAWSLEEFAETFAPSTYKQSLELMLQFVRCPECWAWTGGDRCVACTKLAAKHLLERMITNELE